MIKNYANKVMDYEYNAFMTLMNVSVSKHLFDDHFTVLWANDYFYRLIGYTKEEYEAEFHNHVDEYYRDDPDAVTLMARIITDAYQRRQPGYEFECPMHVKGGKTAWIRVTGRFTDELFEGVPVIYTIYTEITELKQLQQQLMDQSDQLSKALDLAERASRAKSSFLSQMSHDIRTPLNAIVGMTDIAAMHTDEPDKIQSCLRKISLSSQHLLGLINDVLDMSKIESGKIALNREFMPLPEVLENVVAIMQPVIQEKNQHFSVRLLRVVHESFLCDALRLRQILLNVLSNASKFTPENGSIALEVEELPPDADGAVRFRFTCSDTGLGIQPEFLPHLFEAFTRERDSRVDKLEGSGLGLAITKRLTELFGGTIAVQSQVGKGSAFIIELPLETASSQSDTPRCEGIRVLAVDDDPLACEYLAQTLKALGAQAYCCENGADAVKELARAQPAGRGYDIVLLDWRMPGMDGLQTARTIRRNPDAKMPILIASAYDWSDIEDEARNAGINGFLQKPLFQSTLCKGFQLYLNDSRPVHEKKEPAALTGKRILLMEDNLLNREIAVELLSTLGVLIETAVDGAEGLDRFRQSPDGYYDLILMDIQMPNMNGYEAARELRSLARRDAESVPIIAMTADAFAEDVEMAKNAGMNSHLSKPFDLKALRNEICRFL